MAYIELNDINKYYGENHVLKGLTLHIPEGSIYGLLGPNGSGKTTTIRIINGLAEKNSGQIFFKGQEIINQEDKHINQCAGVLTENAGNYETLTALDNLLFFGKLYELTPEEISTRAIPLLKELQIFDSLNKKVKTFSTGMKKRLNIVRALLPNPEILFLDEPTSGLDPETSEIVNKLLLKLNKEKHTTIVLCTHQLKYAEDICTNYGFIKNGQIVAEGDYASLLNQFDESMYLHLKLSSYPDYLMSQGKLENDVFTMKIKDEEESAKIIKELVNNNISVYSAAVNKKSLTELYFDIVEGAN